ncbi:MAG TPA: sigma-70 factor domain-containing protein, partial [Nonomuraea sp.]|nr:sigma-70 factor domain-containing protein [Nonomuraea sp.]
MARPTGSRTQEQHVADRDLLGTYLAEIGRVPLLTAEEEVELAKRIEAGLFAEQLLDSGGTEPRIGDAADEELERL